MSHRLRRAALLLAAPVAMALLAGCSGGGAPQAKSSPPTGQYSLDTASPAPGSTVQPNRYEFGARIDNPWFPLWPGTRMRYVEHRPGGTATEVVTVTRRTRMVSGVVTTVVHTTTRAGGTVQSGTAFYAQDIDGNVWLFGRDPSGAAQASWMSGQDGAKPLVVMPARPQKGSSYGGAEAAGWAAVTGRATVVAEGATAHVPAGRYTDLLVSTSGQTRSYYAKGTGLVLAQSPRGRTELVKTTLFD
ncbi:MAG TPA: hypothetical protein VFT75_03400 [Nocardioidaceae bacterium]|nr:hypothetical protein [Nocardioidaceae bacterium]